jgi:DNA/RNA endonuclease G (NUC1)
MSEGEKQKLPVVEIIEKIVRDESFRADFFSNRSAILSQFDQITDAQKEMLEALTEQDIEFLKDKDIEEFYLADSAVYVPSVDDEGHQTFDYLSDEYDFSDFDDEGSDKP